MLGLTSNFSALLPFLQAGYIELFNCNVGVYWTQMSLFAILDITDWNDIFFHAVSKWAIVYAITSLGVIQSLDPFIALTLNEAFFGVLTICQGLLFQNPLFSIACLLLCGVFDVYTT